MNNIELGRLVKQKYPEYATYSDEEVGTRMLQKYPQYSSQESPKSPSPTAPKAGVVENWAPTVGSIAGSKAGPIGTGLGYSIGNSFQKMVEQMRLGGTDVLANVIGKSQGLKMTPYGEQRTQELGMTGTQGATPELLKQLMQSGQKLTNQPEFSYGQEAAKNIGSEESKKNVQDFYKQNLEGSVKAAVSDFVFSKASKFVLDKALPKVSPLYKVKGIRPETINKSAEKASVETWNKISTALDKAEGAGKGANVAPIIKKVEEARDLAFKGYTPEEILSFPKDNEVRAGYEGFNKAIKTLKEAGGTSGNLTPNKIQTLKSLLGKEVVTASGGPKVSSNVRLSKEITGRKIAGGELKNEIVSILDDFGLKNPAKAYGDWAKINNLKKLSSGGLQSLVTKDVFGSKIIGSSLGVAAGIGTANPLVGLAAYLALTPYGQQLLREGVKLPFKVAPAAARAIAPSIIQEKLQKFLSGEQE